MRRPGSLLSFGIASAAALLTAYGCNGPISDWPPRGSDDSTGGGKPVTSPGGGAGVADASVISPPGAGGVVGGAPGGVAGGSTAGGGVPGGGAIGSMDASGPGPTSDAGVPIVDPDAGSPPDSGALDPDAGEAGWPADAGCNVAPTDGGVPGADAGLCAAYGCGVTLDTLNATAAPSAACGVPEALALACSGELARAAILCIQDNALGLGLGRPVTTCLRRTPRLAGVPGNCLQCYADEALCTLSRCFVACIDGSDPTCEQCRARSCGAAFSACAGIPQALQ